MVHRRTVNGEELIFGVHGALLGNAMTWWDHSTGSIWTQPTGEAIAGPRKGQTVELLSALFTTWEAWLELHPDTLALNVPAGPSSFDLGDFHIVVDFSTEARSYPVEDLRLVNVVNDTIAGVDLAVVSDPTDPQRWSVFSRVLDGALVELEVAGDVIRDRITGTTFEPVRGVGIEGPLADQTLDQLPGFTAFPDDVPTSWPDAEVWSP